MENLLSKIAFPNFILFVVIILLTFLAAHLVNRMFKRIIARATEELKNDPTNYIFLRHAVSAIIYMVGFSIAIYVVPSLRALANSLLAGAGILAVAVGFASQQALSNIISGLFIVIFKPFRINDRIKIRELEGIVEDITLRHTVVRDFENKRILLPNTLISDEILINSNLSDDRICKWITISISYDSDIDLAKQIIKQEILNHPLQIDSRTEEQIKSGIDEVPIRVINLGVSGVDIRAWAWANNPADGFVMTCDLLESIKKQFDTSGIIIPYPHQVVIHKNAPNIETPNHEK